MTLHQKSQAGISLIESLVSIVVLSLGILGLIGFQMRTLADTQTSVKRAQAIKIIEDFSERLKVNPDALSTTVVNSLNTGFTNAVSSVSCTAAPGCTPEQHAQNTLAALKTSVQQNLPFGQVAVFGVADETDPNNRRQLGVMISWRENEKSDAADYKGVFTVDSSVATCQPNRICHLQYVQLVSRCAVQLNVVGPNVKSLNCPRSATGL
jgi:type IV pilus assembly protein PilV